MISKLYDKIRRRYQQLNVGFLLKVIFLVITEMPVEVVVYIFFSFLRTPSCFTQNLHMNVPYTNMYVCVFDEDFLDHCCT